MFNYCFRKIFLSVSIITMISLCYFLFIQSNYIVYFNVKNGESYVYDCCGYFYSKSKIVYPDNNEKIFYQTYSDEFPFYLIRFESSGNPFSRNARGLKFVPFTSAQELEEYASISGEFLIKNDFINAQNWYEGYRDTMKSILHDLPKQDFSQSSGNIVLEPDSEMDSVVFSLFLRNFPNDLLASAVIAGCALFVVSPIILIIYAVKKIFA